MSYRNLLDEIRKGLPGRGYILTSSDRFLHVEAMSLIRGLVSPGESDFNYQVFNLLAPEQEKPSFEQIIDVLNTVPFFSGRKYVVIENVQKAAKKEIKKLEQYLQNPSDSSVLVLLHEGSMKKEMKEGLKGIKQIALDIRESEIPAWVKGKAKLKGVDLSEDAAQYLLALIGPDLGMLSTEVDKFTLIGKTAIGRDDIAEIIEGKRSYGAFDLIDAIRRRDVDRMFGIYRILRETEEPYTLLGALNWQYSQTLTEENTPTGQAYLAEVFRLLHRADIGIKTGGFYPMELLLVKLLRLSRKR